MSVRATTTHIDKYEVTHRIDLVKTGYGGSATELRGTDGFIQFTHENLSESDVFSTPIQRGRLDYGVWIDSDSQRAVIDEIFASQESEFLVEWYIDNVLFWIGTLALDLSNFDEGAYPYRAQLTAKDLTYIEGLVFPDYDLPAVSNSFDTRRTLISVIAECLPYGLNIVTATSWIESGLNSANDFLRQTYVDAPVFSGLSKFEVLDKILRANCLFIRQTDGVWLIEQLSAHITPSAVTRWTYNASGVYQSEAVVNPIIVANSELSVVTGSLSSIAPAYKSVTVRYESDLGEMIEFPDEISLVSIFDNPIFTQQYISQYNPLIPSTGETIRIITTCTIERIEQSSEIASRKTFDTRIRIQAGDWYASFFGFLSEDAQWFNTPVDIRVASYFESFDPITKIATYKAQINLLTKPIPAPIDTSINYGLLKVQFFIGQGLTTFTSNKFELIYGNDIIVNQLTQGGQFSTNYETAITLGDGPRAYALTSLRRQTGALSLDKVTSQWQRRGSADWRSHGMNLAKEIIDFQRTYARTLQVVARGHYSPSNILAYDLTNWYYIGGSFDGFTGDWTMVFVRNSFSDDLDGMSTSGILSPRQVSVGLVSSVGNQTKNTIDAVGAFLMRVAVPLNEGSISQVIVSDVDEFTSINAGQIIRVVHPVTLQSDEFTVTAPRTGSTINVTTKTITTDYPVGAYIFLSAKSIQAGILVGENAVRIYAEGQSLGRLVTAIDGTVTSINAHLYTKLVRGMDFLIINQQTGRTYSFNVDQATAGPGVVTFDVQEQIATARVGDYLVGDNSFQQSQITVTQGQIVLKVNANNKVAQIKLGADDLGSEIDISAEQVKINGIIFTEGSDPMYFPGDIATLDYDPGVRGWKIDGDGSAEFNNVVVRGEIEATTGSLGDLDVDGTLTIGATGEITNVAGDYIIDENGIQFFSAAIVTFVNNTGAVLKVTETLVELSQSVGFDTITASLDTVTGPPRLILSNIGDYGQIIGLIHITNTTESTSTTSGAFKTSGGVGIAKNLNVGGAKINFANLPTSDTGLDVGDLWRDGNTVKVKT
jgi:hypothetical protein